VYQQDVPDSETLSEIYDDLLFEPKEARAVRGLHERRGYAFQVEEMLKYFARHPSSVHVLDYGMGWGSWLQMAQAYGCRVSGAELSVVRAESALPGVEVLPTDGLPTEVFDFINTEQVFEHLVDPFETGTRLVGALRPGGLLRISVPNGQRIRSLLEAPDWFAPKRSPCSLNPVAPLEHLNCFTHDALTRFGHQLGLRLFRYPTRQFLEPWERARFMVSALVHVVRRPKGTLLMFRKS
jgi:hypothetical protein